MKVGDYVKINVGESIYGFVTPTPASVPRWQRGAVHILITKTPDGAFVGGIYFFRKDQVEVLSEGR